MNYQSEVEYKFYFHFHRGVGAPLSDGGFEINYAMTNSEIIMEHVDRDPDTLDRPEWNSLENNYDLHDIGEQFVRMELNQLGYEVEQWGIDKRHHDDGLIFDGEAMDLKVYERTSGKNSLYKAKNLKAIIDIKTKRNESWYGTFNRRHFRHYLSIAHEHDVPVLCYMALVDDGTDEDADRGEVNKDEARIIRDTFVQIHRWEELKRVREDHYDYYTSDDVEKFLKEQVDDHPQIESTWRAGDGNLVIDLDLDYGMDWPTFTKRVVDGDVRHL